jgi:hypothetical protein
MTHSFYIVGARTFSTAITPSMAQDLNEKKNVGVDCMLRCLSIALHVTKQSCKLL